MRGRRPSDLSIRHALDTLDGVVADPGPWVRLLAAEAAVGAWRLSSLQSLDGRPFEARIAWSAGHASGQEARISVARGTSVSVFARSVTVDVRHASTSPNRVFVAIADGQVGAVNHLEARFSGADAGLDVEIPPFATHVRLELADPTALPAARVDLYDGQGVLRSRTNGDAQPSPGIALGEAERMNVTATGNGRLVFRLAL